MNKYFIIFFIIFLPTYSMDLEYELNYFARKAVAITAGCYCFMKLDHKKSKEIVQSFVDNEEGRSTNNRLFGGFAFTKHRINAAAFLLRLGTALGIFYGVSKILE